MEEEEEENKDDSGLLKKVFNFIGNNPGTFASGTFVGPSVLNPNPIASVIPNLSSVKTKDEADNQPELAQVAFTGKEGNVTIATEDPIEGGISFEPGTEEQRSAITKAIQQAGAPTISSVRTEDAPAAFMDPENPGKLLYANQELADRYNRANQIGVPLSELTPEGRLRMGGGETISLDEFLASKLEADERARREVTNRMLAANERIVAERNAASAAMQQRQRDKSQFFLAPEKRSGASKPRFTDAQLRRMYPDEADRARAEAGFDPDRPGETFDEQDTSREQEARLAQQRIAANDAQLEQFRKDNRPEYDVALETANNILNNLQRDFPQNIRPEERNRILKDLLFDILGQNLGLQDTDLGSSLEEAAINALALDAQDKGQKTFVYQGKTYDSKTKKEITES